jgi:hypothetical protein
VRSLLALLLLVRGRGLGLDLRFVVEVKVEWLHPYSLNAQCPFSSPIGVKKQEPSIVKSHFDRPEGGNPNFWRVPYACPIPKVRSDLHRN